MCEGPYVGDVVLSSFMFKCPCGESYRAGGGKDSICPKCKRDTYRDHLFQELAKARKGAQAQKKK